MSAWSGVFVFMLDYGLALIGIAWAVRDAGRRVMYSIIVWIVLIASAAYFGGWWDRVTGSH